MIYLDTSAFVKLIWRERETVSLQQFLAERVGTPLVSSALITVEVRRAVLRADPTEMSRADLLLTRIGQLGLTRAILEAASRLPDPQLRSLDAIHLATALLLHEDLTAVVTYDKRLATAATSQHLP
ncbi:MAG: type II toxin-antitoxin system VapC family toxin, partial [Egibacteraceae bacterium]